TGKLLITSIGLGRMTGEIHRSSEPRPDVAIHHTSTMTPTAPTPTRRRVMRGGDSRSVKSERFGGPGIYLAGAASAGYTFTSTRRFLALLSGSAGSAGRAHPIPAVENWFGWSDGYFRRIDSFTEFARFSDSSCTRLLGTDVRIEPSVCPSITMRAAPYWPASVPTSLTIASTFGS